MDPIPILLLIGKIVILVFAVKIAKRKHRSALLWFFICLFSSVIGILILIVLPPNEFNCQTCGAIYEQGQMVCDNCNSNLPDKYVAEKLAQVSGQLKYDKKCENCEMPYRIEDYDEEAEKIYCSRCNTELIRA